MMQTRVRSCCYALCGSSEVSIIKRTKRKSCKKSMRLNIVFLTLFVGLTCDDDQIQLV